MGEDPQYIKGKILRAIQGGKKHFREIVDETKFSANTITKYTRELEKDGLIIIEFDRNLMKLVYKLNKAKMDEINKLIEAYLESEAKEFKEKIEIAKTVIPEHEKIKLASYFIAVDEEKRKRIEKMLEEILSEGEAK